MQARGSIFRLFYRGFSPYYYFRKYFHVLSNFKTFTSKKKKYFELKEHENPSSRQAVQAFNSVGWTFLSFDSNRIERIVESCNEIAERYLRENAGKVEPAARKDFWSIILNSESVKRHPDIFDFARDDYFRNLATLYLGQEATLADVSLIKSFPNNKDANHSQLWHQDADDTKILIFYVYCSDVDSESGPFVLAARNSVRKRLIPRVLRKHGFSDADFDRRYGPADIQTVTGKKGTLFACDTVNTFHFGSRCDSKERLALTFRYTSFSGLYPVKEVTRV
jgi:hypothetical protein